VRVVMWFSRPRQCRLGGSSRAAEARALAGAERGLCFPHARPSFSVCFLSLSYTERREKAEASQCRGEVLVPVGREVNVTWRMINR
jgi:hypothetical protein